MKKETKQFTMKMDDQTRQQLELLSNNMTHRYNLSAVIRDLIKKAYEKYANK